MAVGMFLGSLLAEGTAVRQTMRRRHRRAERQRYLGTDDGFRLGGESSPFRRLQASPAADESIGGADHRIAMHHIAESDRGHSGDPAVVGQTVEQAAVDQGDGVRLQIDGGQDQLGLAAGGADHQIEVVGGLGRGRPQRLIWALTAMPMATATATPGEPPRRSTGDAANRRG